MNEISEVRWDPLESILTGTEEEKLLERGDELYEWLKELFPICRSITGNGVRQTLRFFQQRLPALKIHEVPSGTTAFDWTVPPEWNIRSAWIKDPQGNIVVDFEKCNLHVVGYSIPVQATLSLDELQPHLHSLPEQPDAIPYITSYYQPYWGFCLSERQRASLQPGLYTVHIDSTLGPGNLTYADLVIPGRSTREVFLSTYICHPSLANNELSGPVIMTAIAEYLQAHASHLEYTYRLVYLPETIGSIVYLSRHLEHLKRHVVAGFNLTCLGDERSYSILHSRYGNSYADRIAVYIVEKLYPDARRYSYLARGSDERQYCAPGVDLPVVCLMRTKYAEFDEYHTSLDNLDFVTPDGLQGGYRFVRRCLNLIEHNFRYRTTVIGEPQLGKRGLYPSLSTKHSYRQVSLLKNVIAYSDGTQDVIDLAKRFECDVNDIIRIYRTLLDHNLVVRVD